MRAAITHRNGHGHLMAIAWQRNGRVMAVGPYYECGNYRAYNGQWETVTGLRLAKFII